MGELRVSRDMLACREWPRGWVPKEYWTPVRSSVPALVMTGALDAVTPPRYGERVAKSLPNSRMLVLPGRGHDDADDCVFQIDTDFITAGRAPGVDTSCFAKTPPQSFALTENELAN
jgi:pimeloyl-ACP methyl ester carboxylesterase